MNDSLTMLTCFATAGWSEAGGAAVLIITLLAAAVVPIYWISHGSWLTALGLCLLATDIVAIIYVGRFTRRLLRDRMRVPEWLIGVPMILVCGITVAAINVAATTLAAKLLPSSLLTLR